MAKYEVVRNFTDLQDDRHIYRVGDKYPRSGRGKKERIEELSGTENALKQPLIKEVVEDQETEVKEGGK
ncbi:hypothetical protein M3598_01080 [Cytobacillus oceanisediminis]|uniref:hypothetical protein n=1 Tax=Cytobacillus oceanisediminis TaxID=665099 RepID=UPI00203DB82C|nr:hypothetical protein [Cytobacillus oceanisediminis]MCM3241324.1 hypothetical protein [Cytobacillus oceanisediminis]